MSSRSMNYLRKNAKVILVVMGIVCMFTFVIGAALTDLASMAQQRAANPNPVVVTWTKGKVQAKELQMLRYRHEMAYRFLYTVIRTALERGGKPVINGRPVTMDQMQMFDVGIPASNSEESAIQTLVLAEEARRMGVVVDHDAVIKFLGQISSPELKQGDWLEIAQQTVSHDSQLSVNQLFEHLAYELKAQHVRMLALAGLYAQGVGPIVPPGEAFELFSRLNRRFAIEAYPVEVVNFVGQVKGEPTPAELQKLFEEGQHRDPNPNLDEPGFHKPHKLAFKWLKVSFAPFLEEAKKQITDEQIEEAYQKDIGQGLHKVLELPATAPGAEAPKDAEKSIDDAKETEKPADKPAEDAKASDAEKPAETKGEVKPSSSCGDVDGQELEQPASPANAKEEKATDRKAKEPALAPPATADKPAEDKPTDKVESPADAKPDTTPPATATDAAPVKEPKFKPLSEVRAEILTRLAQPIAEEARKKAVAEIVAEVEKYGKAFRRYQDVKSVRKTADVKEPGQLDIVALATKYGFPMGETPLVDPYEVAKTEIGQKVQQFDIAAAQMGQFRMLSFADIAYGPEQPLYKPEEARSSEPDISYVYFRTAEEKAADVTLKDVREQVIAFWKQRRAYELALAEAKKLAEKAKGASSLAEVASDPTRVVTPPPFAWMTTGGFGFGQPELSPVPGVELPGREFMQGVFSLKPGETGVAPNQSHDRVYVVRVINQEPDDEKLRAQFLESGYNNMVLMLAQAETLQTSVEWYRGVADQYQVKWQRPPQDDRRM